MLHPPNLLDPLRTLPLGVTRPANPALTPAPTTPSRPLVPAGAGPETAREGSGGDIMSAVTAVPAVDQAITRLKTQALDQVHHDWSRLTTGDRVLLITTSALVAGGALAGVAATPTRGASCSTRSTAAPSACPAWTGSRCSSTRRPTTSA